jgi:hypothetical protein
MTPKEKANKIFEHALKLHGIDNAKQQALNTANAIRELAQFEFLVYWDNVINNLKSIK